MPFCAHSTSDRQAAAKEANCEVEWPRCRRSENKYDIVPSSVPGAVVIVNGLEAEYHRLQLHVTKARTKPSGCIPAEASQEEGDIR